MNIKLSQQDIQSWLSSGALIGFGNREFFLGWGSSKQLATPNPDQETFFSPDFYLETAKPWIRYENNITITREELVDLIGVALSPRESKRPKEINWSLPKKTDFKDSFATIQKAIEKGEISKAVPAVFAQTKFKDIERSRLRWIEKLISNCGKRIPYGMWNKKGGILGASPEILFSYNPNEKALKTMALAGTRKLEDAESAPLMTDEKEMYEHGLVVEGLKQKLQAYGTLNISPTYVWDLGSICHLRTDVDLEIENPPAPLALFTELIGQLHPTAALGLYPVEKDFKWLRKIDLRPRGRFGAPFGVYRPTKTSTVLVAIRNIQWQGETLSLGTGCGIVASSRLEQEWNELNLKRETVQQLFEL